jgi:hypothetical protein
MNSAEWSALADALKQCLNSNGTLHYDYDARLDQTIGRYAPANCDTFDSPKAVDYRCKDRQEVEAAIDRWIKVQQRTEGTCIITHAQLELERDDEKAKTEIMARLGAEGKMLVQGVHKVTDLREFPDWQEDRPLQAKALFNVGVRAMEVFQQKPTALVLFPNLTIPDSRVFGGFYGSPWSTFNNRSLRAKFRNANGHFQIHVCTVAEREERPFSRPSSRKVGVLFTYINPW